MNSITKSMNHLSLLSDCDSVGLIMECLQPQQCEILEKMRESSKVSNKLHEYQVVIRCISLLQRHKSSIELGLLAKGYKAAYNSDFKKDTQEIGVVGRKSRTLFLRTHHHFFLLHTVNMVSLVKSPPAQVTQIPRSPARSPNRALIVERCEKLLGKDQHMLLGSFPLAYQKAFGNSFQGDIKTVGHLGKLKDFFAPHPQFEIRGKGGREVIAMVASPSTSQVTTKTSVEPPTAATVSSSSSSSSPFTSSSSSSSSSSSAPILIDNSAKLQTQLSALQRVTRLAVDCEGVDLSRTGRLCLIQIAFKNERENRDHCLIFDIVALSTIPEILKKILANPDIPKILHDSRRDVEALQFQFGIKLQNIKDTQVVFGLVNKLRTGATNGTSGPRIGLNALLEKYDLGGKINSDLVSLRMKKEPRLWEDRPLDPALLQYAAGDVLKLLLLYDKLEYDVREAAVNAVSSLSQSYSQWYLPSSYASESSPKGELYVTKVGLAVSPEKALTIKENNNDSYSQCHSRELEALLKCLPEDLTNLIRVESAKSQDSLLEVVVDIGRPVALRFSSNKEISYPNLSSISPDNIMRSIYRNKFPEENLETFNSKISNSQYMDDMLTSDNRTGLRNTLHRISAMRARDGSAQGITIRIGRQVSGVAMLMFDILKTACNLERPKSVLLLGRPGVGKTTLLRDIAFLLANEFGRRVIVVDTSDEIAGDGDVPHGCIGRARRMCVPDRHAQHEKMLEAVQNHNPQVLIIDEIGTSREVEAAKLVAQRGVSLVATAHGIEIGSLLKDPTLAVLVGGLQPVILGDAASTRKKQEQSRNEASYARPEGGEGGGSLKGKTRVERKGAPTFEILVELREWARWRIHTNVAESVDAMLEGRGRGNYEERWIDEAGFCRSKLVTGESLKNDWIANISTENTPPSK